MGQEQINEWSEYGAGEAPDLKIGPRWPWPQVQIALNGDWSQDDDGEIDPGFWSRAKPGVGWSGLEAAAFFSSGESEDGWLYARPLPARIIGAREAWAEELEGDDGIKLFSGYRDGRRGRLQLALVPELPAGPAPQGSEELPIIVLSVSGVRAQRLRAGLAGLYKAAGSVPVWALPIELRLGEAERIGKGRQGYTLVPVELAPRGASYAPSAPETVRPWIGPVQTWRAGQGLEWRQEWAGLPK